MEKGSYIHTITLLERFRSGKVMKSKGHPIYRAFTDLLQKTLGDRASVFSCSVKLSKPEVAKYKRKTVVAYKTDYEGSEFSGIAVHIPENVKLNDLRYLRKKFDIDVLNPKSLEGKFKLY